MLVQIMVGPSGGKGEEAFDLQLLTPRWLEEQYSADGLATGENRLFVFRYDWKAIEEYLKKRVAACSGKDWTEVAEKIGRFARWEFLDYED